MSKTDLYLNSDSSVAHLTSGVDPIVTIFGVPFDATSTYRTGTRFGPNAIREAFMNIEIYSKRLGVDLENSSIEDIGNLSRSGNVDDMCRVVESITREIVERGRIPAILGGEHSITNGSFRALDDCTLIVFDAHLDMRDEFEGLKLSHATFLRRLVDDGKVSKLIHVGSRAATKTEWDFTKEHGFSIIDADMMHNGERGLKTFQRSLENTDRIYVSIDIDAIDPAFAPGVANPEANGLSTQLILECIYALKGKELVGFDIVELCPPYDHGETAILAARLLAELTSLVELKRRP